MSLQDPTWRINPQAPSARAIVISPNEDGQQNCVVSFMGRKMAARSAGGRTLTAGEAVSFVESADGPPWVIQISKDVGADYPTRFSKPLSNWEKTAPSSLLLRYIMRDNQKAGNYRAVKILSFDEGSGIATFAGGSAPVKFGTEDALVFPGDTALMFDSFSGRHIIGRRSSLDPYTGEGITEVTTSISFAFMPLVASYEGALHYDVIGTCSTAWSFCDSIVASIYIEGGVGTILRRRIMGHSGPSYGFIGGMMGGHAYMFSLVSISLTVSGNNSPHFWYNQKFQEVFWGFVIQPDSALEIVK